MIESGRDSPQPTRITLHRSPLYEQCADHIRSEVTAKLQPGEKLPSESNLAKQFSVSVFTIREALRILADEGIVERRHGSGTYVTTPAGGRHVAILVEANLRDLRFTYFFLRAIHQLQSVFESEGFGHRLYVHVRAVGETPKPSNYAQFVEDVEKRQVCGVAVVGAIPSSFWMKSVTTQRIPIVGYASDYDWGVDLDYIGMVKRGTSYLLEQGCDRLALMGWANPESAGDLTARSISDFKAILHEHGVSANDAWIRVGLNPTISGAGWEGFREAWSASDEKPNGLLVLDDVLFQDTIPAILELGIRVPEQLAIVTYANRGSGIHAPFPVARMECDPDLYARSLGEMLLKLMRRQLVEPPKVLLPFRWIESEAEIHPSPK